MADEPKTAKQLEAELIAAVDGRNFKEVRRLSGEMAKTEAEAEKKAVEDKKAALSKVTDKVKKAIDKVVQGLIEAKELDAADGVWYSNDFGEQLTTCRLLKSQPKARSGGSGGAGKKFSITTTELLSKHGDKVMDSDTGVTFNEAFASNTDGNARYTIRTKLLKLEQA